MTKSKKPPGSPLSLPDLAVVPASRLPPFALFSGKVDSLFQPACRPGLRRGAFRGARRRSRVVSPTGLPRGPETPAFGRGACGFVGCWQFAILARLGGAGNRGRVPPGGLRAAGGRDPHRRRPMPRPADAVTRPTRGTSAAGAGGEQWGHEDCTAGPASAVVERSPTAQGVAGPAPPFLVTHPPLLGRPSRARV